MGLHKVERAFPFPLCLFLNSSSFLPPLALNRTGISSPFRSYTTRFLANRYNPRFFALAEHEHPGGGHKDPAHPRHLPQAGARHRGIRGGEGRGDLEANLRQALDHEKLPRRLWHVWVSEREEIQHQRLQVRAELCVRRKFL